jgi:hypothetical protein
MNNDTHLIFEAYIKEAIDVPRSWDKQPKMVDKQTESNIRPGYQLLMLGHDYTIDANQNGVVTIRELETDINKEISLSGLLQIIKSGRASLRSAKPINYRVSRVGDRIKFPGSRRTIVIRDPGMSRCINVFHVNKIIRHVERFLADASAEGGSESENCWTLAIDKAHRLGLEGQDAIRTAKYACKELGYTIK